MNGKHDCIAIIRDSKKDVYYRYAFFISETTKHRLVAFSGSENAVRFPKRDVILLDEIN